MGFSIAQGTPHCIWAPVGVGLTCYVGQIVVSVDEGVAPMAAASGLGSQAHKMAAVALIADGGAGTANNLPFGVVIGTNKRVPAFNSTYKTESITYVAPSSATADDYAMVEGPWAKGDLMSMVKIALITSETVLRGQLYDNTFGTALPTYTIASGASTGGMTTATIAPTPFLASGSTFYFKDGAAAGAYRISKTAHATTHTWDQLLTKTCAAGDTIVHANLRTIGQSMAQFDSTSQFIDMNDAQDTNYWLIDVLRLNLEDEKSAFVEFRMSTYSMLSYDDIV